MYAGFYFSRDAFIINVLEQSKILILDEVSFLELNSDGHIFMCVGMFQATSAIDLESDQAIQDVLRGSQFHGVTRLTIAHRLHTIIESDRILVLDAGKVSLEIFSFLRDFCDDFLFPPP